MNNNPQAPDYPVPDPSWEYCQIWNEIWQTKYDIDRLIKEMSRMENANEANNNTIEDYLHDIQQRIALLKVMLDDR